MSSRRQTLRSASAQYKSLPWGADTRQIFDKERLTAGCHALRIPHRAAVSGFARVFLHLLEIPLLVVVLRLHALDVLLFLGLLLVVLHPVAIGVGFDEMNRAIEFVDPILQVR